MLLELGLYDTTSLSFCKTEKEIDEELNSITKNSPDYALKVKLLHTHMGISQAFECSPHDSKTSMEEEYVFACHHLLHMNKNNK